MHKPSIALSLFLLTMLACANPAHSAVKANNQPGRSAAAIAMEACNLPAPFIDLIKDNENAAGMRLADWGVAANFLQIAHACDEQVNLLSEEDIEANSLTHGFDAVSFAKQVQLLAACGLNEIHPIPGSNLSIYDPITNQAAVMFIEHCQKAGGLHTRAEK